MTPSNFHSSPSCFAEDIEVLTRQAQTGCEQRQLRLLLLFEPLLGTCVQRAALMLPFEDHAVLIAEARYGFLLLLDEFDVGRGMPFVGYIKSKLPFHMFNWCRSEQKRLLTASFDEDVFEPTICAMWMCQNASKGGGGRGNF